MDAVQKAPFAVGDTFRNQGYLETRSVQLPNLEHLRLIIAVYDGLGLKTNLVNESAHVT